MSYGSSNVYLKKCRLVNLLPLTDRFKLNDLIFMHKIIHNIIPLKLPNYLSFFSGLTRLRSSHLDSLSLVHDLPPYITVGTALNNKSFFFRTLSIWNSLPLDIRQIETSSAFKSGVIKHFWKVILDGLDENEEWLEEVDMSDADYG